MYPLDQNVQLQLIKETKETSSHQILACSHSVDLHFSANLLSLFRRHDIDSGLLRRRTGAGGGAAWIDSGKSLVPHSTVSI